MIRVLLAIAIVAAPLRALADPAAADRAAAEAEAFAQTGEFAKAAAKFREAYKADQRPDLYCNIGIATYKAQQLAPAHLLLGQCLDIASLDPQFVETARAVLASIETTMRAGDFTPVNFRIDPRASSVTIDSFGPDEAFVGSRVVWLPYGTHKVTAHAEGHRDHTVEIITNSRDPKTETITLEKLDIGTIPSPPPTRLRTEHRSKLPAIGASAVTGVALVFFVVSYTKSHASADLAATALDQLTYEADRRDAKKWNTRLAISSVVAILGAGASGFLWYRALSPKQIEVRPETGGATVSFGGRF